MSAPPDILGRSARTALAGGLDDRVCAVLDRLRDVQLDPQQPWKDAPGNMLPPGRLREANHVSPVQVVALAKKAAAPKNLGFLALSLANPEVLRHAMGMEYPLWLRLERTLIVAPHEDAPAPRLEYGVWAGGLTDSPPLVLQTTDGRVRLVCATCSADIPSTYPDPRWCYRDWRVDGVQPLGLSLWYRDANPALACIARYTPDLAVELAIVAMDLEQFSDI